MFRPFPSEMSSKILMGKKGVVVLERTDQPLAADLPLIREVRTAISKAMENGTVARGEAPDPEIATRKSLMRPTPTGILGLGSRDLQPELRPDRVGGEHAWRQAGSDPSVDFLRDKAYTPKQEIYQQAIAAAYPGIRDSAIRGSENPNLMPKNSLAVRFHSVGGWGAITTGKNLAMTLFDLLGYHIKAIDGSGKEGPAHHLLSVGGSGTHPDQLRVHLRGCGAFAGSERITTAMRWWRMASLHDLLHMFDNWMRCGNPFRRFTRRS